MIKKIRYGKKEFIKTFIGIVLILFVVRLIFPSLTHDKFVNTRASQPAVAQTDTVIQHAIKADSLLEAVHAFAQTAHQLGYFLSSEEQQDNQGNEDHFARAKVSNE